MTVDHLATNCNPVRWEEFIWNHDDKTKKLIDRHGISKAFLKANIRALKKNKQYIFDTISNNDLSVRAKRDALGVRNKTVIKLMSDNKIPINLKKPVELTKHHIDMMHNKSISSLECAKVIPRDISSIMRYRRKHNIITDHQLKKKYSIQYSRDASFLTKLQYVESKAKLETAQKKMIILDNTITNDQKANLLGVTMHKLYAMAKKYNIFNGRAFTKDEMLIMNDNTISCSECVKILKAEYWVVNRYRKRNNIRIS